MNIIQEKTIFDYTEIENLGDFLILKVIATFIIYVAISLKEPFNLIYLKFCYSHILYNNKFHLYL